MLHTLLRRAVTFLRRDDGPAAVEYAVMLALIVVVCVATVGTLGLEVEKVCWTVCEYVKPNRGQM